MKLKEINRETPEGRLLFAALAILTTTEELTVLGKVVTGTMKTPDEMIEILKKVADAIEEKVS